MRFVMSRPSDGAVWSAVSAGTEAIVHRCPGRNLHFPPLRSDPGTKYAEDLTRVPARTVVRTVLLAVCVRAKGILCLFSGCSTDGRGETYYSSRQRWTQCPSAGVMPGGIQ
jgi:hypothetical protein